MCIRILMIPKSIDPHAYGLDDDDDNYALRRPCGHTSNSYIAFRLVDPTSSPDKNYNIFISAD